jgi:hypothetical protein
VKGLTVISAGLLCWLAPELFLIMLPGFIVTVVAKPEAMASGLSGHYLFPVLPWVFAAAARGAGRLQRAYPAVLTALSLLMLGATVADSPLWRRIGSTRIDEQAAAAIRSSLHRIPPDVSVLAMPNLVPHIAHRRQIATVGGATPLYQPEWVAVSSVGDLWPLDTSEVEKQIELYASDRRFERVSSGPLYLFRRVRP